MYVQYLNLKKKFPCLTPDMHLQMNEVLDMT